MSEMQVASLVAFLRSVAMLAMAAPEQVAWLNTLGLPGEAAIADELALEFNDGYLLIDTFISRGWLTANAKALFEPIDAALAAMSDPDKEATAEGDVWVVGALGEDPRWEEVRLLARRALVLLG